MNLSQGITDYLTARGYNSHQPSGLADDLNGITLKEK